jgi:hypothetical protein
VGKLLGFDFSVEYKTGDTNTVADALSRRDTEEAVAMAVSGPHFDFVDRLRQATSSDPTLVALKDELTTGTRANPWSLIDGLMAFKGRLYIPPMSPLLQEMITVIHDDATKGVQRTLHRLRRDFHSPNLHKLVQDYVRACITCQRYKLEHLHPAGLLLLLPVPMAIWADVGLKFIEALPHVGGKSVILTMVDRFSKYCHFMPSRIRTRRSRWPRCSSRRSYAYMACRSPWSLTGTPSSHRHSGASSCASPTSSST